MKFSNEFKLEVKTGAVLAFMGLGAVAAGVGCLTGALRTVEIIAKGDVKIWEDETEIQEVYIYES